MTKMRTMRVSLVTGDTDCLPDILAALAEPCLGGESRELAEVMNRAPAHFRTPAAFWTAVVYAMGWMPEQKQVFSFREDVRNALIGCSAALKKLNAAGAESPHSAYRFMLNETVGDYVRAASLLGIDVVISLPMSYGEGGNTFAAIRVEHHLPDHDEPTSLCIAQLNPFDGSVKRLYSGSGYMRQAYSIETRIPEDQGSLKSHKRVLQTTVS